MHTPLTYKRRFVLKGYLKMLETAPPNGALNHLVSAKRQVLMNCLAMRLDILPLWEQDIKSIINRLYPRGLDENRSDNGY